MVSGNSGAKHYAAEAQKIADLGYYVLLFDIRNRDAESPRGMRAAVEKTLSLGFPGKVAVVGYSLGGLPSLAFAPQWPELVTGVVVWYPATTWHMEVIFRGISAWNNTMPVLMLAGENDDYGCCNFPHALKVQQAAELAKKTRFNLLH
jgi:dienelactone hydrolase